MPEIRGDRFAYAGIKPCGCIGGFVIERTTDTDSVEKLILKYLTYGWHIQRFPVDDVDLYMKHRCCSVARYAYVGVKECGCIVGHVEDTPENRTRLPEFFHEVMNQGCHIERVSILDTEWTCNSCRASLIRTDITPPLVKHTTEPY